MNTITHQRGLRKITKDYKRDHILDFIDIKSAIEKNRFIDKINEDLFIYKNNNTKDINNKDSFKNLLNWEEIIFELANLKQVPAKDYYRDFVQIGKGSFGTIYSAYDKKLYKKVAIKVFNYIIIINHY